MRARATLGPRTCRARRTGPNVLLASGLVNVSDNNFIMIFYQFLKIYSLGYKMVYSALQVHVSQWLLPRPRDGRIWLPKAACSNLSQQVLEERRSVTQLLGSALPPGLTNGVFVTCSPDDGGDGCGDSGDSGGSGGNRPAASVGKEGGGRKNPHIWSSQSKAAAAGRVLHYSNGTHTESLRRNLHGLGEDGISIRDTG